MSYWWGSNDVLVLVQVLVHRVSQTCAVQVSIHRVSIFVCYANFHSQGVTNFVLYKFGHLAQKEWQTMYDLAKMFLHCLNHWKLETPAIQKQHSDDVTIFKVNYTRSASILSSWAVGRSLSVRCITRIHALQMLECSQI